MTILINKVLLYSRYTLEQAVYKLELNLEKYANTYTHR